MNTDLEGSASDQIPDKDVASDNLFVLQNLGTNAEDLTDYIFNLCVRYFIDMVPGTEATLKEFFPSSFSSNEEFHTRMQKLVKQFYATLSGNSEIFEKYLHHCTFNIPENIVLPETQLHQKYTQLCNEHGQQVEVNDVYDKQVEDIIMKLKSIRDEKLDIETSLKNAEELEGKLLCLKEHLQVLSKHCKATDLLSLLESVAATTNPVLK